MAIEGELGRKLLLEAGARSQERDAERALRDLMASLLDPELLEEEMKAHSDAEHRVIHALGQVVVGTGFDASIMSIGFQVRQHHHGDKAGSEISLELTTEGEAILPWHDDVQKDQVWDMMSQKSCSIIRTGNGGEFTPQGAQAQGNDLPVERKILDEQDA